MISRFARMMKRLRGDSRGNLLLMAGAGMTAMVGAAGLGVDTVHWFLWKRQLQQSVDSGALAGALSLSQGQDHDAPARATILKDANTGYTITGLNRPPATGSWAGDTGAVEVIATTSSALPFSSLFLTTAPTIEARAVATAVAVGDPCVRALATDGIGIDVFGGAQVNLGCPVSSNSPGGVSVDVGGSSYLNTNMILSVGGINYGSSNVPTNVAAVSYGLPVGDPLASRNLSNTGTAAATCSINNKNVPPSNTETLDPCTYRNGLRLQGTVFLNGGIYVIDGGTLQVNSTATVKLADPTQGVTFVLTGSSSNQVATISINGSAEMDLKATTSAQDANFAGILFYQDPIGVDRQHTVNGGTDINLDGAIYMPTGDLTYNGDSTQTAQCLLIVVERVKFGGTNNIDNNCNTDLPTGSASAQVIRVVE